MSVTEVENLAQFHGIINAEEPAIFDFWAEWCGPCKAISPIFEKLAKSSPGLKFYKVDVDAVPDVSHEAGVRAMPTFQVYASGSKLGQVMGARPAELQKLISEHAAPKAAATVTSPVPNASATGADPTVPVPQAPVTTGDPTTPAVAPATPATPPTTDAPSTPAVPTPTADPNTAAAPTTTDVPTTTAATAA